MLLCKRAQPCLVNRGRLFRKMNTDRVVLGQRKRQFEAGLMPDRPDYCSLHGQIRSENDQHAVASRQASYFINTQPRA